MSDETRRWLDSDGSDVTAELRDVLASAAEDHADVRSLTRLRAGVENTLGPAAWHARAPGHGGLTAGGQASAVALGTKLSGLPSVAIGVTAVLALGLGGYALRGARHGEEPARDPVRNMVIEAAPVAPVVQPAAAERETPAAPLTRAAPARAAVATPRVAARVDVSLAEELKGLDRIRRSMDDPARALVAVDRQARRFASGALVPERELLQLEALYRSGQRARAAQLAERITDPAERHPYRVQALQLRRTHEGS